MSVVGRANELIGTTGVIRDRVGPGRRWMRAVRQGIREPRRGSEAIRRVWRTMRVTLEWMNLDGEHEVAPAKPHARGDDVGEPCRRVSMFMSFWRFLP